MAETVNYNGATLSGSIFTGSGAGLVFPALQFQSNVQTFNGPGTPVATGGTFTWVKPLAGSQVLVECWGGGGGGNGPTHSGGGGGGYVSNIIHMNAITAATVSVTVGDGGNTGADGTASIFGPITGAPDGSIITGPFGASSASASGGGGGGMLSPGGPLGLTGGEQGGGAGGIGPATTAGTSGIIYGGGGGGAGPASAAGGTSAYGGGGGGSTGGTSIFGGPGGSGAGGNGVIPGGGGGAAAPTVAGVGASGQVRVTVF